jgi:hypothetical protein
MNKQLRSIVSKELADEATSLVEKPGDTCCKERYSFDAAAICGEDATRPDL